MTAYVFNIGDPFDQEWWEQNIKYGLITTGWEGDPGDRGTRTFRRLQTGDLVIACCSGIGYVGYGRAEGPNTYDLLTEDDVPPQWRSTHRHFRGVTWEYVIEDFSDAISITDARRSIGQNTCEEVADDVAERISGLIRKKGTLPASPIKRPSRPLWKWAALAVQTLYARHRRPITVKEVTEFIRDYRPDYKESNTGPDLTLLSVNAPGRRHQPRVREGAALRSDPPGPYDLLYKEASKDGRRQPGYEPYDPRIHGVWEMFPDYKGKPRLIVPGTEVGQTQGALEAAQDDFDEENDVTPITSDEDARERVAGSVIHRRGQTKFRNELLRAYGRACAVTGTTTEAVLEAAHIKPHKGMYTDRVDNGLLLRSDVHTLFDLGLLWVEPATLLIRLHASLLDSEYGYLDGRALRMPSKKSDRPKAEHLEAHIGAANIKRGQVESDLVSKSPLTAT